MKEPSKNKLPTTNHRKQYQKPVKQVKKNRYVDLAGLAIILILGVKIYSNTFDCSFHFDDYINIVNNTNIRNILDVKTWWNFNSTRPIGTFTFALNYHFNQLDIKYYHLVNLIVHLINTCLIWWLTLLIFSSPAMKDQPIAKDKKQIAFLTALLFVSHPLATQSVTYIVQRLTSMVAMFYLLSIALYVKARVSDKGNKSKAILIIGSMVSAVLAMLTKENAFTLPFAILLTEIFFLRTMKQFSINFRDYRVILITATLLGMIMIIPLKFSFSIFNPLPPMLGHAYTITSFNYFLTQFSVIVKYIQLLFLPVNQVLDYDFPISTTFFEIRTLLSFLVLLSLIVLAIFSFKRYRIISFGIFWFFLTLSIESSFIPISDLIFEHRTYLPSFGFFLILSSGIYLLFWNRYKYIAIAIFIIIIGSNSYLAYERNKVWKDDLTLWSDNVEKTPNLPRPLLTRGFVYGNLGQYDKAIADFSRVIEIDPKSKEAYYDRGIAYATIGQVNKSIADYSRLIEIDPRYAKAYSNRGADYFNLGQLDKAIADYTVAIAIDPNYPDAYYNRGLAYGKLGKWENAIADYTRLLEIDPNNSNAYSNRQDAYEKLQEIKK
jgi:regulator of sirC expression with transglutaminase-like and TPR domain